MLSMTSCRLKTQESTSDPGIVILYADSDTVHTALGQPGSPVAHITSYSRARARARASYGRAIISYCMPITSYV